MCGYFTYSFKNVVQLVMERYRILYNSSDPTNPNFGGTRSRDDFHILRLFDTGGVDSGHDGECFRSAVH